MSETTELGALRRTAVLLDGESHDVLGAGGNDRVSFLHRITSGRIAGLEVGEGGQTLLLEVRGHVLASLCVFVCEARVRLLAAYGQGTEVAAGLSRYAVMDDFQIALEADLATLAVLGPKAVQALGAVGVELPPAFAQAPLLSHADVAGAAFGPLWVARSRACGSDGLLVVAARPARQMLVEALHSQGTRSLSPETAEGLRIVALEPASGKEITPDHFPVEVGLGAAIDHGKGCYVGQETIVRMRDRGNVRKRLVLVRLDGDEVPSPGDKVSTQAQPAAGQITSAGRVPGERPLALAVVAGAVPVGAAVQIQHGESVLPAAVVAEAPPPWG